MVSVNDILEFLWTIAPEAEKESWDNVGHLVGRGNMPVTKVLAALDITKPVIQEATEIGAELIVSHHPVIWDTYKHVTDRVLQQDKVMTLIEHRISAICMHTNLDEAEDGVDDTLAEVLGLRPENHLVGGRIGHICTLDVPMTLQNFLKMVKTKLHANGLRYIDSGKSVKRVALGCGSCGEYLEDAVRAGCDTFLTGDIKHNYFVDALDCGLNLIDAGHYPTEAPIVKKLQTKLQSAFPQIFVQTAYAMQQPDVFFI